MPRSRKRRPNWPYRFAWLAILASLVLYVVVQTLLVGQVYQSRLIGTDWPLAIVAALLDTTIAVWFVTVGGAIGSFLNVVAYRLPLGRHIGGHSSCPYCRTPIDSLDNVPVLAWIELRGRCRSCRLPISIQYPLVELAVALAFLSVYLSEFASGGGNFPGHHTGSRSAGLLRVAVTPEIFMRLISYLVALSGLIGAALIAVRSKSVPFKLYFWSLTPLVVLAMVQPNILIVPWRAAVLDARLNAIATLLCGAVAGVALARLLLPIAYRGFDPRLLGSDAASRGARNFIGAMGVSGMLVGWQAVVGLGWTVALCGVLGAVAFRRFRGIANLGDSTTWVWCGLLLFRANWNAIAQIRFLPDTIPPVVGYVLGALLLAPMCVLLRNLSAVSPPLVATSSDPEE